MTELPLVIVDVQRGGPSTGLQQNQNNQIYTKHCLAEMAKLPVL